MAEREELQKRYAYHEMSNKVESTRRSRPRGEATGEVEGIQGGRMGDRVAVANTEQPPKAKKAKTSNTNTATRASTRPAIAVAGETILDIGSTGGYQPTQEHTRAAYEAVLHQLASLLGKHQSPQVLKDAAEEVLLILKDPDLRDPERHEQLSQLLVGNSKGLTQVQFTSLVQLAKQLDDYHNKNDEDETPSQEMDEEGVAVVFDESEDEENRDNDESDVDLQVVADSSSSSSSEDEGGDNEEEVENADEEEKVVMADTQRKSKLPRSLSTLEIDAHFLQRQLAMDDAQASQEMAQQILDILTTEDPRECENRLLILMGLDRFETIQLLLHNRLKIWACVSFHRAQTPEQRTALETTLTQTERGQAVWKELHAKGQAQDWTTRERRQGTDVSEVLDAVKSNDKPDDNDEDVKMQVDDAPPPSLELDLETLALRDNRSAKACVLPDTSWRATKPGYEEVHVPATRSVVPPDEKLVHIVDLPAWTQAGFKGMWGW